MLDTVMTAYHKLRQGLIGTLSGADGTAYEETNFYDLGYMQTMVKHIKKELKTLEDSLDSSIRNEESTPETNDYRNDLMKRREMLIFHMIFTMSNSFSNLDNCRKLSDGHDFKFMTCIDGLEAYKNGDDEEAFDLIEGYFREYGSVENHYLINKVFGIMLVERGLYDKAIPFLSYALGFVPDDMETLFSLDTCYLKKDQDMQHNILAEIKDLLGYQREAS